MGIAITLIYSIGKHGILSHEAGNAHSKNESGCGRILAVSSWTHPTFCGKTLLPTKVFSIIRNRVIRDIIMYVNVKIWLGVFQVFDSGICQLLYGCRRRFCSCCFLLDAVIQTVQSSVTTVTDKYNKQENTLWSVDQVKYNPQYVVVQNRA